jgi:RHS repeat-associated protein
MRIDYTISQTFYYQDDHEGSVTHLTSATGTIIEKYKYDAFGAPTIYSASNTQLAASAYKNRFLFTGREYAATFSFYKYRARAYNPTLGRFMSEDPKGFDAGDYNLFRYCHNDPEDLTDPMGLEEESHYPRTEERKWDLDKQRNGMTIAERISLWQVAKESTIAGESAAQQLGGLTMGQMQQTARDRVILGGNATLPMNNPSHYTDEKLRNELGPAAGLTKGRLDCEQGWLGYGKC